MFQVGDYIIYGMNGVCVVENIGEIETKVVPKDRLYYTLRPYYSDRSTIFTPTDNLKVKMRSILTKDEAVSILNNIHNIDCSWDIDEKIREMEYKEAIRQCDCKQLLKIVKSLYFSRKAKLADGKKVPARDEKYYHMAEDSLYGELAVSLGLEIEETKELVLSKIEDLA
ncbi:CarD family transcriptional regulator [Lachnoclostridium phytofermentans]|uniref:Transcriptional regulator, CarD family n=1 Tax=Lachnoclostridium phytofermentans (strain ATCC 700394 / DSM 18823 / ISDg) TaxID=357809 RepID=A9KN14_LACP7|nr:CarD family transcriptional regulator [Lachnoclostridium phytofermentans]ABX43025.1 transcriptional regulator, CarD family [Lachnoclostridium phytofermentans ISDg]